MFLFLRKDWLNICTVSTPTWLTAVLVFSFVNPRPLVGQRLEPIGSHLVVGISGIDGYGLQLGAISARTLYATELVLLSDLQPLLSGSDARSRAVLMPGVSVRLLGFERLIGGAPYRGYDLDVGFRAGPGLSFSQDETQADKDRRFELVVEPFVRMTAARSRKWIWYSEAGISRPNVRVGLWIRY